MLNNRIYGKIIKISINIFIKSSTWNIFGLTSCKETDIKEKNFLKELKIEYREKNQEKLKSNLREIYRQKLGKNIEDVVKLLESKGLQVKSEDYQELLNHWENNNKQNIQSENIAILTSDKRIYHEFLERIEKGESGLKVMKELKERKILTKTKNYYKNINSAIAKIKEINEVGAYR